jgi:hypothetical protein
VTGERRPGTTSRDRYFFAAFVICATRVPPLPTSRSIEQPNSLTPLEVPTMAQDKAGSRRKRRSKALPVLGAAGLSLTLASAASAAIDLPAAEMTARPAAVTQEITLAEEEISGASLATFHVFDKENAKPQRRPRLAMGVGGCAGCAGCGGCWTGTYYTDSVVGGNGGYVGVHPVKPHKYAGPRKRAPGQ